MLAAILRMARTLRGRSRPPAAAPGDGFAAGLARLAAAPGRLRAIVAALSPADRTRRPPAGGFSCTEHACHLRDVEAEGYGWRLERVLAEERPSVPELDAEALALARGYQAQDALAACDAFAALRAATVARLAGLPPAQRQRLGLIDGRTPFTLDEMVVAMQAHDRVHLELAAALAATLVGATGSPATG